MRLRWFDIMFAINCVTGLAFAQPYQELIPSFNRIQAAVFIRKIEKPTLANLDFAAYDRNPILVDQPAKLPQKKPSKLSLDKVSFNGVLSNCVNAINEHRFHNKSEMHQWHGNHFLNVCGRWLRMKL
jgi:hypothetical protein